MKYIRSWMLAAAAAAALAACGGGGDGDQSVQQHYGKMVVFGDSLSDVGTYSVTAVAAAGGGKYSVNGAGNINWTQRVASVFGLGDCAAETGLNSVIPGFAEAATFHADCYNYAQGGARVTDPVGPGNVNTYPSDPGGALGQLTVPVFTQIQNHLGKTGGKFAADDLVTVLAGGNDVFMNMAVFQAQVGAGMDPTAAATAAATAMGTAGAQLAGYIKAMILANGATRVVVVNLPDVSQTPYALSAEASFPGVSAVINSLVTTFNQQLSDGLKDAGSGVLLVDAYTQGRAQTANPAVYGITNVTTPACDLAKTQAGGVPLATSLVCTSSTLISGDVSHYEYADSVHPTPYGYQLLAQYVIQRMTEAGWL